MENAVKALYIAAGVLIAVMILSLAAVVYSSLQGYVENTNQQIEFNEINSFNTQYLDYANKDVSIQDIVTVAGNAYENNYSYSPDINQWNISDKSFYVQVLLNGTRIDQNINDIMVNLLENNKDKVFVTDDISYAKDTSIVCSISFKTK